MPHLRHSSACASASAAVTTRSAVSWPACRRPARSGLRRGASAGCSVMAGSAWGVVGVAVRATATCVRRIFVLALPSCTRTRGRASNLSVPYIAHGTDCLDSSDRYRAGLCERGVTERTTTV